MALHSIPRQKSETSILSLAIDKDLIDAMNRWRFAQKPPLSAHEAVIELLRRALHTEGQISHDSAGPVATDQDPQLAALVAVFNRALSKNETERSV